MSHATPPTANALLPLSAMPRAAGAGGVAAALGELAAAGLDVPPGFAVAPNAVARLLEESGVAATLARELQDFAAAGPAGSDAAALRQRILATCACARVPSGVPGLAAAYEALSAEAGSLEAAVTVRAHPAGLPPGPPLHNVRGTRDIAAAVLRAAGEALSRPEAAAQASAGGPLPAVTVVVQRMVPADTVGRATLRPDGSVEVHSTWGLEAAAPMDRFVLDADRLAILSSSIARKASEVVAQDPPAAFATRRQGVDGERAESPSLTPEELFLLARAARTASTTLGGPASLEFAVEWVGSSRRIRLVAVDAPVQPAHVPAGAAVQVPARHGLRLLALVPPGATLAPVPEADGAILAAGSRPLPAAVLAHAALQVTPHPVLAEIPNGPDREPALEALRQARAQGAHAVHPLLPITDLESLRESKRVLSSHSLVRSQGLQAWARIATPAAALTADRLTDDGVDGFLLELDAIAAALGATPGATGPDGVDAAVVRLAGHVVAACAGTSIPVVCAGAAAERLASALAHAGVAGFAAAPVALQALRTALPGAPRHALAPQVPYVAPALAVPRAPAWWTGT